MIGHTAQILPLAGTHAPWPHPKYGSMLQAGEETEPGVKPDLYLGSVKLLILSVSSSPKWPPYQFLPHRVVVRNKWLNAYEVLKIAHTV